MSDRRALMGAASGGSVVGGIVLANGSFAGPDSYTVSLPVGTKMAQTNFLVYVWAEPDTEYNYDNAYKAMRAIAVYDELDSFFDLSSDGTKAPVNRLQYTVNNDGTITNLDQYGMGTGLYARYSGGDNTGALQRPNTRIIRSDSGFTLTCPFTNANYKFISSVTYNYKIVYYGNNPASDIVTVS